ncbi:MAG: class I SAM-dependent rRNA methyltransferase [Thermoanaerobaculia bacterium]
MHDELFSPANRKRLVLKRGREGAVKNRHPWIFGGAIGAESGPDDAAIADLVDGNGVLLASGFHSRSSQIRLRALTFGEELGADLIRQRVSAAIERRSAILTADTTAARLVNAEGDELSGVVIDRYGDLIVMEIANRGAEQLRSLFVDVIRDRIAPRLIFFKNDLPSRTVEQLPMESEWDGAGEPAATILESGLRFLVEPHEGQKTGFFLDQRENRRIARTLASGARVLNLFSYSGAFGVYAAAGGASSVENVDSSAKAIELAKTNHELNGTTASFTVADAFGFVRQQSAARQQYDLVVCDPPAFAKSRREVDRAARGYKDINLYALRLIRPGGRLMTFSCSGHMSLDLFQKVIFSAALDAGRRVSFLRRLTAAPDHPVSLFCPEGEYLKGFLLEVS